MSVPLDLDHDVALVLFELLVSRENAIYKLDLDTADIHALWQLEGALEKRLSEPFKPDYKLLLENAKQSLVDRFGPIQP